MLSVLQLVSFAVRVDGRDVVLDRPSNPQFRLFAKELQSVELAKNEAIQEPQPILKQRTIRGSEGSELSELKDSVLLVHSMREQIESAKEFTRLGRLKKPRLLRELKLQIKENERALGNSVVDSDLPRSASEKMKNLGRVLARATEQHGKCEAMVKRLRSSVLANEEEVLALKEEGMFLGRLAARTMPRGLHCLALQLTIQYFNQIGKSPVSADETKLENSQLYHYAIYTENILAATAIVNSTIFYAKEPHKHIFHILTDGLNYAAMQMWFWTNTFDKAFVEVKNLDDLSSLRISRRLHEQARKYLKPDLSKNSFNPEKDLESVSKLGSYYYLPEIFPKLDKLLVLEDDVVVRKDLTSLWKEDLHKKVIGAVKSCETSNRNDMLWWSCMNVLDLQEWRRQSLTEMYKWSILNGTTVGNMSVELIGLYNNTRVLDDLIYVVDLDETHEVNNDFQNAAAIHYRGYAKPWLGIGLSRYRSFWTRFVNYDNPFLQECNINK